MPDTMHMLNNGFPGFSGEESLGKKMQMILDYQWSLKEELRYLLRNLQAENFNETGLREIGDSFTKPIYGRLEDAEGDIATLHLTADELALALEDAEGAVSSLRQTVEGITLTVENGETSSVIKLGVDGVVISSQTLQFTGDLVVKSMLTDGSTEISGDNITTGKISAERIDTSELRLDALYVSESGVWKPTVYGERVNMGLSGVQHVLYMEGSHIYIGREYGSWAPRAQTMAIGAFSAYIGGMGCSLQLAGNEDGDAGQLGFFGTTPISRRSLSNSATVADVIAGLKAYGLFS